jgi:hypothetical protein
MTKRDALGTGRRSAIHENAGFVARGTLKAGCSRSTDHEEQGMMRRGFDAIDEEFDVEDPSVPVATGEVFAAMAKECQAGVDPTIL